MTGPPVLTPGRTRRHHSRLRRLGAVLLALAFASVLTAPVLLATDSHPVVCGALFGVEFTLVLVVLAERRGVGR